MAKILLVDDEPDVLKATRMVLRMDGHEVETTNTSHNAVARILSGDYDLAIVDLMMPIVSGEEILEQVKVARPDFPILLLSGTADMFSYDRLVKLGAISLLDKPFEPQRLLELVRLAVAHT